MFALVLALCLSASCAIHQWEFHHQSSRSNETMNFSLDLESRRIMDETMCRSPPRSNTLFRLQPYVKTMRYLEKDKDKNETTKIKPCRLVRGAAHDTALCCEKDNCTTIFELPCKRPLRSSIWDYALEVDITFREGVIMECFVICLDPGYYEDDTYHGGNGISYLDSLKIIAAVMIVATASMLGVVLWYLLSRRTNKKQDVLL